MIQTTQSTQPTIGVHWVDQVTQRIFEWQKLKKIKTLHVDDMKTPSGRVHVGALRGVLIHDTVYKALLAQDKTVVGTYVFNDMDSMDGLPGYIDPAVYQPHMGESLFQIPAPALEGSGIDFSSASEAEKTKYRNAKSFAEFYAFDFIEAFRKLGVDLKIVWSHELYESGQMDATIRLVLDNVDKFRKVYQEVADYKLPEKWYPFQPICPQCRKIATTHVTAWDGTEVTFDCQEHKVKWAQGCGYHGRVSPFGGTGKLLWKADWPAHWQVMGVTIEGAGKDHTSAGGSRDMANAIIKSVFAAEPPFDIPYEWILLRGAKMSSSKGVGTSAREFVELFPMTVGRFLFISRNYNQVIDFDPRTMAIPDLFDDYDQSARAFWTNDTQLLRQARSFELAQNGVASTPHFLPRFRDVAIWMQYPEIDLQQKFAEIKGQPLNELELAVLEQRKHYATIWLQRYAPVDFMFAPLPELPASAQQLSAQQREFLAQAVELVEKKDWHGQESELQNELFSLAKASVGPKLAFRAIYTAFLDKDHGPRVAWFLLSIDRQLLHQRVSELMDQSSNTKTGSQLASLNRPDLLQLSAAVQKNYPSVSVGFAIIRGVQIQKTLPELEAHKQSFLESLEGLTTQQLNEYPEIVSYRAMYKQMGIDWHSRRPSPEALLRRVAQGKGLYTINTCVDAYNLVVMQHRVSVGAFDLSQVQLPIQLDIAKGGEQILLLGDTEPTTIKPGEVIYTDQAGPYNLDYNYRDAQRTLVTEKTTDLLINVDGVNQITPEQVQRSLQATIAIIQQYCGGTVEVAGVVRAL